MNEMAVLIAAGMGERMRPLTETIAKPLVKVNGKPMIETVIEGLENRGVSQIYIVVGYKKEQFGYLTKKYKNLSMIENTEYEEKNNISSIYAARNILGETNCFICEADLYVSEPSIFDAELGKSCYYGKMVEGHSDDWVFEQDGNGKIIRVGKGGDDVYNMVGISYFLKEDARLLAEFVNETYSYPGHERLFWDEVVNQKLDRFDLVIHAVKPEQIVEIDTIEELVSIDPQYRKYN